MDVTSLRHPLPRALLVLTFTTGLIDAVSYLGLGRVFTANMTGNVVLLGFGIAGSGGLPVVAPLISLAAFLAGSRAGGLLVERVGEVHHTLLERALAIEVALVAASAIVAAAADVQPRHASGYSLIVLLAVAMGVRNAAARQIGVPDLTTTVLTGTLTGLAAKRTGGMRRAAAVVAMLAGAVAGALLLKTELFVPLAVAAALALATWAVYVPSAARAVD